MICPGANDPCTPDAEAILERQGILFLPDFVANAGGILGTVMAYVSFPQAEIDLLMGDEESAFRHAQHALFLGRGWPRYEILDLMGRIPSQHGRHSESMVALGLAFDEIDRDSLSMQYYALTYLHMPQFSISSRLSAVPRAMWRAGSGDLDGRSQVDPGAAGIDGVRKVGRASYPNAFLRGHAAHADQRHSVDAGDCPFMECCSSPAGPEPKAHRG